MTSLLLYALFPRVKQKELTSFTIVNNLGRCSLDVEMETGTGKTYVYIKTMYELNKHYGWSKFIVVVPSIAIREGVKKSFETTQDHFMEQYGKKVRFFVYNSSNLNQLDAFSSNSGINVMIINMRAFNTSMKEGGKSKEARIIYDKRDGNINILGNAKLEDSMMRLESKEIAAELMEITFGEKI